MRRTQYIQVKKKQNNNKFLLSLVRIVFFFCPPTKTCKRKLKLGAGGSLKVFQNLVELPLVDWGLRHDFYTFVFTLDPAQNVAMVLPIKEIFYY